MCPGGFKAAIAYPLPSQLSHYDRQWPVFAENEYTPQSQLWNCTSAEPFASAAAAKHVPGIAPDSLVQNNKDACPFHNVERVAHLPQKPDVLFSFRFMYSLKCFFHTKDAESSIFFRKIFFHFQYSTSQINVNNPFHFLIYQERHRNTMFQSVQMKARNGISIHFCIRDSFFRVIPEGFAVENVVSSLRPFCLERVLLIYWIVIDEMSDVWYNNIKAFFMRR